ncbi:hypothetical protein B4N89_07680 [Embleya scabrispora]|uniref:Uncharacterized protein n=1 Tax=Embleya scabrispora TaxID=159449 RepID=A0A1T3NVK7_9ACTN|nr:hypothetical protein B4N89_07680 [Embleya scabrispora]
MMPRHSGGSSERIEAESPKTSSATSRYHSSEPSPLSTPATQLTRSLCSQRASGRTPISANIASNCERRSLPRPGSTIGRPCSAPHGTGSGSRVSDGDTSTTSVSASR